MPLTCQLNLIDFAEKKVRKDFSFFKSKFTVKKLGILIETLLSQHVNIYYQYLYKEYFV